MMIIGSKTPPGPPGARPGLKTVARQASARGDADVYVYIYIYIYIYISLFLSLYIYIYDIERHLNEGVPGRPYGCERL